MDYNIVSYMVPNSLHQHEVCDLLGKMFGISLVLVDTLRHPEDDCSCGKNKG